MRLDFGKSYVARSGNVVRIEGRWWASYGSSDTRYKGDNGIVYEGHGLPVIERFYVEPNHPEELIREYTGSQQQAPTAPDLLMKAADLLAERGKEYDTEGGERSMGRAVASFNAITGRDMTEAEGWLLLQQLKDVRQWQNDGYHADSAEDCISYAALKAETLARR